MFFLYIFSCYFFFGGDIRKLKFKGGKCYWDIKNCMDSLLFIHSPVVYIVGSEEPSPAVSLQILIQSSREEASGPQLALDSPAWASVLLHGISSPTYSLILYICNDFQFVTILSWFQFLCVMQWDERPLLKVVMWSGLCLDGGLWAGSLCTYGQTVGH